MKKPARSAVKERLSRDAIVTCAVSLADAEGLDAVTIRRLAQDQGVTPMALYWHFRDKDLLLEGVVERLLAEVALSEPDPDAEQPWDVQLRDLLEAVLQVLRAHPSMANLVHTRIVSSQVGLALSERAFGLLREAGFEPGQACQIASQALLSLIMMVVAEPGRGIAGEDEEVAQQRIRSKRAALQSLSPEKYPNVVAAAEAMTAPPDESAYFDLVLDMVIQGIRGIRPRR
jgi:TetR/AcrR family tetracycline transcriptional repressor